LIGAEKKADDVTGLTKPLSSYVEKDHIEEIKKYEEWIYLLLRTCLREDELELNL